VSDPDPFDPGELGPMGFLGDLARMMGQQGPSWEGARQLAVGIATEGRSEPNIDPLERMRIEQIARVADLHVADLTGLSTAVAGRASAVVPVNRTQWIDDTLRAYRPLIEQLAKGLGASAALQPGDLDPDELGPDADQITGFLQQMMRSLQPMMASMTAGSMVGHLGRRSLGSYELPIPRPAGGDLSVVVPNVDEFGEAWSLPPDDLRLWICVHEITHHAVLGVAHVRGRLDSLLTSYVSSFRTDGGGLEARLGDLDPMDPSSMSGIQELLGDPEALLGAIRSPEQEAILPQLASIVAVVVGVVDHVLDVVGGKLIPSYGMLTEALRRRRVEASEADRFVERMLGLELVQDTYDRGASFVDGVVERAGEEGLRRLWDDESLLPTPAEIDAPGLWLARIDLPGE
jgi:putative hydrolase